MTNQQGYNRSVTVNGDTPIRSYERDGVFYPSSSVLSLLPIEIRDIPRGQFKRVKISDYTDADLYIQSFFVDQEIDDSQLTSSSRAVSYPDPVLLLFRIIKGDVLERKIRVPSTGNTPGRAMCVQNDRLVDIYSPEPLNSILFFCRAIYLEPQITIP